MPSVNNSYKWAGGGFLSTVGDLLSFADVLLYDFQNDIDDGLLKRETIKELWTPVENARAKNGARYGMGWTIVGGQTKKNPDLKKSKRFYVSHSGGAVGASSILLIKPNDDVGVNSSYVERRRPRPRGITVAVLTNLQECGGLTKLALDIASVFE